MSRITASVAKLARAMASTTVIGSRPLLDSADAGLCAVRLLIARQSSRGVATAHRVNRPKPLIQTFHSTAPTSTDAARLDAAVIPSMAALAASPGSDPGPRVPLLPDNYAAAHGPATADDPVQLSGIAIVAANPDMVLPATPLSEVEGLGLDGVELKFAHDPQPRDQQGESRGIIRDLWKGMVEGVLGPAKKSP